jgi:hypothetical protein
MHEHRLTRWTDVVWGSLFFNENTRSPLCGLGTNAALQENEHRVIAKGQAFADHSGGELLGGCEDEWRAPLIAGVVEDKLYSFQPPGVSHLSANLNLNPSPQLGTRLTPSSR